MKVIGKALTALFAFALPSQAHGAVDARDLKIRPVSKVINLLQDMLKQLDKERKEDEEIYDKLACWCETNDREKTNSIADAEKRIKVLGTRIEDLTALSAQLNSEIQTLNREVSKNQKSLDKATALRMKQLEDFNAEEADLLNSVNSLKSAVTVLSKHNGGALLQVSRSQTAGVAATLQRELKKHAGLLEGVLTHAERRSVAAFVQAAEAQPTFKQAYAAQSGQIFGVLKQMQETFEANLDRAQKDEKTNQRAYEDLKAAKEAEIAAGQAQITAKTNELADTDESLAHDKQDLEDTTNTLSADQQFLLLVKQKCSVTDKEFEERQKTRGAEVQAVSKALSILSGDDAHDLFTRTFNPAFLQRSSAVDSQRRAQASAVLSTAAKKLNLPRLATLAVKVRLDAFEKVKKSIDDMVAQLLKQKEDEIKHKDFCVDEFNTNQLQTEKKERESQDLDARIEDIEGHIRDLQKAIDNLKAEIAELQVQLKRAGENRDAENKEFQATVADQRATEQLLQGALNALGEFYGKKSAALLAEPAGPPPPSGFKAYTANEASGGVMGLLQQIINDAKAAQADAIRAEQDGQQAYEAFVVETNTAIEAKSTDIANKSEDKAKAEGDLVETKAAKASVVGELAALSTYNAQLHKDCDFVLNNFDIRQAARDEEVDALRQAKAILSGANFEEFLQRA